MSLLVSRMRSDKTYTGRCHRGTKKQNDRLSWLWGQSTALYPSIYLPQRLAGSVDAALMVRYREFRPQSSKQATKPLKPRIKTTVIYLLFIYKLGTQDVKGV